MKRWLALSAAVILVGCGDEGESAPSQPQPLTGHLREIYSQQKGVCHTEQRFNTVEYRQNDGATNPQRYAEYAATHGFFEARTPEEQSAAVDGCLDGLTP